MSSIFVAWYTRDGVYGYVLRRGASYYIGRALDPSDVDKAGRFLPDGIYVFRPKVEAVFTGLYSPYVSRRHVLLTVDDPSRVRLVNHGPRGRGTTNPTYINMVKIGTERREVLLNPCKGLVRIKLSSHGPEFLLRCGPETLEITLVEGIPEKVPKRVAERLKDKGLVDIIDVDEDTGSALVLPRKPQERVVEAIPQPTFPEELPGMGIRGIGTTVTLTSINSLEDLERQVLEVMGSEYDRGAIAAMLRDPFRRNKIGRIIAQIKVLQHVYEVVEKYIEAYENTIRSKGEGIRTEAEGDIRETASQVYRSLARLQARVASLVRDDSLAMRINDFLRSLRLDPASRDTYMRALMLRQFLTVSLRNAREQLALATGER